MGFALAGTLPLAADSVGHRPHITSKFHGIRHARAKTTFANSKSIVTASPWSPSRPLIPRTEGKRFAPSLGKESSN